MSPVKQDRAVSFMGASTFGWHSVPGLGVGIAVGRKHVMWQFDWQLGLSWFMALGKLRVVAHILNMEFYLALVQFPLRSRSTL